MQDELAQKCWPNQCFRLAVLAAFCIPVVTKESIPNSRSKAWGWRQNTISGCVAAPMHFEMLALRLELRRRAGHSAGTHLFAVLPVIFVISPISRFA